MGEQADNEVPPIAANSSEAGERAPTGIGKAVLATILIIVFSLFGWHAIQHWVEEKKISTVADRFTPGPNWEVISQAPTGKDGCIPVSAPCKVYEKAWRKKQNVYDHGELYVILQKSGLAEETTNNCSGQRFGEQPLCSYYGEQDRMDWTANMDTAGPGKEVILNFSIRSW